jgi:Protein of unknown function (DUF2934)
MFKNSTTGTKEKPSTDTQSSNRTALEHRTSAPSNTTISHDAIAQLAFQKWQKRGCPTGQDQRDWFEAERELKSRQAGSVRGA